MHSVVVVREETSVVVKCHSPSVFDSRKRRILDLVSDVLASAIANPSVWW